jgi:hypothetical protein
MMTALLGLSGLNDMSGTTTDQLAVIPGEEVMAVERLVAQMADLSVVGGEAG